jgi:hypothetical protein
MLAVGRPRRCGVDGSCSGRSKWRCVVSIVLAGVFAGVEELLGHDPLLALGLSVVAWRVRVGLLVAGAIAEDAGEVVRAVAGAVVGDPAVHAGDVLGGEPDPGSGEECGCGRARLVVEDSV